MVELQLARVPQVAPETMEGAVQAMLGLGGFVARSGLERSLLELVNLRASQLNGCAYCIDMHTKDARARGESEQRLYLVSAWREAPFYSARERAALAWTEAVTLVAEGQVPDAAYAAARQEFADDELVALTMAVVTINAFNRVNVALRHVPGSYQPGMAAELAAASA